MNDYMLTTIDNPFNPFEDFESWFKYDLIMGHDTCGTLAREANISDIASDEINDDEILEAMKRICKHFVFYKMVLPKDYK